MFEAGSELDAFPGMLIGGMATTDPLHLLDSDILMGGDAIVQARITEKILEKGSAGDGGIRSFDDCGMNSISADCPEFEMGQPAAPTLISGNTTGVEKPPALNTTICLDLSALGSPPQPNQDNVSPDQPSSSSAHGWEPTWPGAGTQQGQGADRRRQRRSSSESQTSCHSLEPFGLNAAGNGVARHDNQVAADQNTQDPSRPSVRPGTCAAANHKSAQPPACGRPPLSPSSKHASAKGARSLAERTGSILLQGPLGSKGAGVGLGTSPSKATTNNQSVAGGRDTPFAHFLLPTADLEPSAVSVPNQMYPAGGSVKRSSAQLFAGMDLEFRPTSSHDTCNTSGAPAYGPLRETVSVPNGKRTASSRDPSPKPLRPNSGSLSSGTHSWAPPRLPRTSGSFHISRGTKKGSMEPTASWGPSNSHTSSQQPTLQYPLPSLQQTASPEHNSRLKVRCQRSRSTCSAPGPNLHPSHSVDMQQPMRSSLLDPNLLNKGIEELLDSPGCVREPAKSTGLDIDPDQPEEGWMAANLCHTRFSKDPLPVSLPNLMVQHLKADLGRIRDKLIRRKNSEQASTSIMSDGEGSNKSISRTVSAPMPHPREELIASPNKRRSFERATVSGGVSSHPPAIEVEASSRQEEGSHKSAPLHESCMHEVKEETAEFDTDSWFADVDSRHMDTGLGSKMNMMALQDGLWEDGVVDEGLDLVAMMSSP